MKTPHSGFDPGVEKVWLLQRKKSTLRRRLALRLVTVTVTTAYALYAIVTGDWLTWVVLFGVLWSTIADQSFERNLTQVDRDVAAL